MSLKLESMFSMYDRERENAPVRNVNIPSEITPASVRASTARYAP